MVTVYNVFRLVDGAFLCNYSGNDQRYASIWLPDSSKALTFSTEAIAKEVAHLIGGSDASVVPARR